jgi:hypothetical protein
MNFSFSSTASAATVTPLVPAPAEKAPTVFYDVLVLEQIKHIVEKCPKEVGWWGLVEVMNDGNYLITDIYVPKQTVSGSETDISPEAMGELAMQIINEGKDPAKLYYWGHSHVNMGVNPSGQDEAQVKAYLVDCPIFIREIRNKSNNIKVDVYDVAKNVVFQCVDTKYYHLNTEMRDRLDRILEENVKDQPVVTRTVTTTTQGALDIDYGPVSYYLIGHGAAEYAASLTANG